MMKDLIQLWNLYREKPVMSAATIMGLVFGAAVGAVAFYGGWLG